MSAQSAMRSAIVTTMSRTVTVAAGVFAPGHVGELTRHVPFELVDAVLVETRATESRVRDLPSRVGVYFVLALALFPQLGYRRVWDKLITGLCSLPVPAPTAKALRDLRRRVGIAPVKALFETVAGPLAQPSTPGVRFGRYRTVAFDGCVSTKVADSEPNRSWLGKLSASRGVTGYPAVKLMALVETGTRGLLGAVFGPAAAGDTDQARKLVHLLDARMLVLADRGFDSGDMFDQIAATGAQFLVRLRTNRRLAVLARYDDDTYLARIGQTTVRIIDADITVTCADGTRYNATYRLATTLLDPRRYPSRSLINLYHERWEHEIAYLALRHTLAQHQVLRSATPDGITQEMWAQLTVYQLLRAAMVDAVESRPGTDPDRASFTTAVHTTTDSIIRASNVIPADPTDLAGDIGRAILDSLLRPRRPRTSVRKVKSPVSKYTGQRANHSRPEHSTTISSLTITPLAINIEPDNPTRRARNLTTTSGP